eukprot:gene31454-38847_t
MSWGGLRGAVGMMLGLIVEKSGPKDYKDEASLLFFYVGGISALTLMINATTAKALLSYLGLMGSESPEKQLVMTQIKKKMERKIHKLIDQMAVEMDLSPEDVEEIRDSCTLLQHEAFPTDLTTFASPVKALLGEGSERRARMSKVYSFSFRTNDSSDDDERPPHYDSDDEVGTFMSSKAARREGSPAFNSSSNKLRQLSLGQNSGDSSPRERQYSSRWATSPRRGRMNSKYLVVGGHNTRNHSVASMRLQHFSSMLNMSHRGRNPVLMQDLLRYVRGIFLEIVRVRYWFHIEGGKLPRLSHSAQYLLYSIEVGIDEVAHEDGLRDWSCIESDLDYSAPHEHAQKKIHEFIGTGEDEDEEEEENEHPIGYITKSGREVLRTPEEVEVARAKNRLIEMTPSLVTAIRSKQAVRLVLAKEAHTVKHMVQEGLITANHAEEILEDIQNDTDRLEKDRNDMYRELAESRSKMRHEERTSEINLRRSSVI